MLLGIMLCIIVAVCILKIITTNLTVMGYGYCNFLRISKDGKNAVVLQSADSSHYGDLSNSANKIY